MQPQIGTNLNLIKCAVRPYQYSEMFSNEHTAMQKWKQTHLTGILTPTVLSAANDDVGGASVIGEQCRTRSPLLCIIHQFKDGGVQQWIQTKHLTAKMGAGGTGLSSLFKWTHISLADDQTGGNDPLKPLFANTFCNNMKSHNINELMIEKSPH